MMKKVWLLSVVMLVSACANDEVGPPIEQSGVKAEDTNNDGINRSDLLTNLVENQILSKLGSSTTPKSDTLLAQANELNQDIKDHCSSIGSTTETSALDKAKNQWQTTMATWQQLQMAAVGPLNLTPDQNRIYSWPDNSASACLIYSLAVINRLNNSFSVSGSTARVRGLEALEQVLFYTDLNYKCSNDSTEKQQWQGLNDTDKKQALCHYATAASQDLSDKIKELAVNWETGSTKSDFIADADASLQAFVDALFNLEKLTKDRKLGTPTGLHSSCDPNKASCPDLVESRLSENSIENIRNNIKGFLAIFTGGENGLGFDDILTARLNKTVSQNMISKLEALDTKLANFSGSLESGVTNISESDCVNSSASYESNRSVEACALFGELKAVTDILKTDFTAIVNVNVPTNAAGDGD